MTTQSDNIFNLPDPDRWVCKIREYEWGHSQLRLTLEDPEQHRTLYLSFVGVDYHEGPIVWQGANFRRTSDDECLEILRRTDANDRFSDRSLLGDFALFTVDIVGAKSPVVQVKIVAAPGGAITEEDPYDQYHNPQT
jgi:hypothetical protein